MGKLIKFLFRLICFTTTSVLQITIAVAASFLLILLAYSISHGQLNNEGLLGNDTISAYSFVLWFNRFYPQIPFWFPMQGGGVSFLAGYPYFSHYLVVYLHHLTELPLIRVFNLLRFLAFPISAVSIFFYCWTRLNYPQKGYLRQLIGFIAAVFYLIMPITYIWAYQWGFYAEVVSYILIVPALIFLDWFLDSYFKNKKSFTTRFALIIGITLLFLDSLIHFSAGVALLQYIILIILYHTLSQIRSNWKLTLIKAIISGLLIVIPYAGLFAGRYTLYTDYNKQVALGGFAGYVNDPNTQVNLEQVPTLNMMLGLEIEKDHTKQRHALNEWAIQPYIWFGALLGLLFGWIRNRKMLIFGMMAVYGMLNYTDPTTMRLIHYLGPFYLFFDARPSWTMYRTIIPVLSAYGYFIIGDLLLWVFDKLFSYLPGFFKFNWHSLIRPALVTASMITLVIYAINYFPNPKNISSEQYLPWIKRVGLNYWDIRNIWLDPILAGATFQEIEYKKIPESEFYNSNMLANRCLKAKPALPSNMDVCAQILNEHKPLSKNQIADIKNYCNSSQSQYGSDLYQFCNSFYYQLTDQFRPNRLPPLQVFDKKPIDVIKPEDKQIYAFMEQDPLKVRFDYSGLGGTSIMRAPMLTDLSQIQVYINTLTLFSALWNYQSSVMYAIQPIYQKPGIITQLAQYYGIEYIDGTTQGTPPEIYEGDPNLEKIDVSNWWRFQKPTTLTSWTKKPSVLFIGNQKNYFYDQAFKIFNIGALPYEDAISFNSGIENVDDLELDYLKKFNVLFLEGYQYRNTEKGHDLITQYVREGGHVFIDTGWQFRNPDFRLEKTPPYFPTNQLEWQEAGARARMMLDNTSLINYETTTKDLGFLTLANGKWGVSAPQDLRKNTKVILQTNGIPILVAYKHGQGKVLWSGFNIVPHIEGGKNENEKELEVFRYALKWLISNQFDTPGESNTNTELPVKVTRDNPDKVKFEFLETTDQTTTLYWREAYYHKWRAFLNKNRDTQPLQITMAGPRMIGFRIPPVQKGTTLSLEIYETFKEKMMKVVFIVTCVFLIAYLFNFTRPLEIKIRYYINRIINKTRKSFKNASEMTTTFKMHDDPNQ